MNSKLVVLLTNPDVADLCSELGLQARPEHVPHYVWDAYVKRCSRDVSYRWFDFRTSHALDTLRREVEDSRRSRYHVRSVSEMHHKGAFLFSFVIPELF